MDDTDFDRPMTIFLPTKTTIPEMLLPKWLFPNRHGPTKWMILTLIVPQQERKRSFFHLPLDLLLVPTLVMIEFQESLHSQFFWQTCPMTSSTMTSSTFSVT